MSIIRVTKTIGGIIYTREPGVDIDKRIYYKTNKEKNKLKRLKREVELSNISSAKQSSHKLCEHKGTLTVYLSPKWRRPKLQQNNFKSVVTFRCYEDEINSYLDFAKTYSGYNSSTEDKIIKYDYKI